MRTLTDRAEEIEKIIHNRRESIAMWKLFQILCGVSAIGGVLYLLGTLVR